MAKTAGIRPTLIFLRALNLLAIAGIAWLASGRAAFGGWGRIGLAGMVAIIAPPFLDALGVGNLSPIAHALTLLGLAVWRDRPIVAGLALGVSLAVKPYALLLLPIYFLARSDRPSRSRYWFPLTAATVFGLSLLVFPSETRRMLAQNEEFVVSLRSLSLQRTLFCLTGWGPSSLTVLVAVGLAAIALGRTRVRTDGELALFALTACALGTTRIWVHVLAPLLPSLVGGFADRLRSLRTRWRELPEGRTHAAVDLLKLAIPTTLLFTSDSWAALAVPFPQSPLWLEGLAVAIPLACLILLPRLCPVPGPAYPTPI